jgi:hypothetical protein
MVGKALLGGVGDLLAFHHQDRRIRAGGKSVEPIKRTRRIEGSPPPGAGAVRQAAPGERQHFFAIGSIEANGVAEEPAVCIEISPSSGGLAKPMVPKARSRGILGHGHDGAAVVARGSRKSGGHHVFAVDGCEEAFGETGLHGCISAAMPSILAR